MPDNRDYKRKLTRFVYCETGGGLGTLFIGLTIIVLVLVVFLNIADYSLYTIKRNAIAKALDYAVTASVQQINRSSSIEGIAGGFSETSGKKLQNGIELNMESAVDIFVSIYYRNIDSFSIEDKVLLCATSVQGGNMKYKIIAGIPGDMAYAATYEGTLEDPTMLESKINTAALLAWPDTEDNSSIYINGNPKTNLIENGTYIFALLKDIELKGLFSKRKVNLSSFAGAKVERFVHD